MKILDNYIKQLIENSTTSYVIIITNYYFPVFSLF